MADLLVPSCSRAAGYMSPFAYLTNIRLGPWSRILAPGYSWCYRCRTPWKFVKGHDTAYEWGEINGYRYPFRGCFPLCEKCWSDLGTPEARLPYYEVLIAARFGERGDEIRQAVLAGG